MISIIIPTRNRASLLKDCLKSLTRQDFKSKYEVLVFDNGSKDSTQFVVKEFQDKLSNLKVFYEPEPGLHIGRNKGIQYSNGNILAFVDDDIEAFPSWLSSINECFKDPSVALVGGNNLPMFLEPPPRWLKKLWDLSNTSGRKCIPSLSLIELTGPNKLISPHLIWGCNFSIRKDILLKAGGFHPDGMPNNLLRFRGDGETHVSDYIYSCGMKSIFHPGASVYHKVTPERMSHSYFRQRGFCQGVSDSYTKLRLQKHEPKNLNLLKRLKNIFSSTSRIYRRIFSDREVNLALDAENAGYKEGFTFHQNSYKNDPEVREWVHRPNYFQ